MVNEFDIKRLIEAIRSRPPIWDRRDPGHWKTDLKEGLWKEIIEEMGGNVTAAELKQKWQNLRDCFRREIRVTEKGKNKRKWLYFEEMLFLKGSQQYKKPKKDASPNKSERSFEDSRLEEGERVKTDDDSDHCRISDDDVEDLGSRECSIPPEAWLDDDYHFAMSIIPYMKQVPANRKLAMRIRITHIISEESSVDNNAGDSGNPSNSDL